ncbi:class I SAM-dependent methyltransferase [Oleiphilus messinensis]|uniref:class I SAM-dependent methyltransferase n=1 Tax=Oleiphilus messinensis TaxID=141451 RepID=UPI000B3B4BB5|nr:class I SAM-dependent methyltransferase [Oleiphilus messinensis]
MKCRHCSNTLIKTWLDLGYSPPSNAYLSEDSLLFPETHFPLRLYVCDRCWLVQTEDYASEKELFSSDYAYFSSYSQSWLEHASVFCEDIIKRLSLGGRSLVVEVASNDGYLLKNMLNAGIPCLGIEPTDSTASVAESKGIPVIRKFFGTDLAESLVHMGKAADLIVCNNVLAHVPDINDFAKGLKIALKSEGTITLEFPHLLQLIKHCQFDTVYHEHYSYLSLNVVETVFKAVGLKVFDVDELDTHGGSLRVFACHEEDQRSLSDNRLRILKEEEEFGLLSSQAFSDFQERVLEIKLNLVGFLVQQKKDGKRIAAYGAAAKGNTLLNYCGIHSDLISYVVDASPYKQGLYMPGSHLPIVDEQVLRDDKPDYVLVLPWNLVNEIVVQLDYVREWGGRLLRAVPRLEMM